MNDPSGRANLAWLTDPDARVAARALEPCEFASWPGVRHHVESSWRVFESGGVTKRANSVFLVGEGDTKVPELALQHLSAAALPEVVRVSPAYGTLDLLHALTSAGFEDVAETAVMQLVASWDSNFNGGLTEAAGAVVAPPGSDEPALAVTATPAPSSGWAEKYAAWQGYDERQLAAIMDVFRGCPALYVSVKMDGAVCGVGRVAIIGHEEQAPFRLRDVRASPESARYAVHAGILVDPAVRGRGVGRWLFAAMLAVGEQNGCSRHLLQVETDNALAVGMYERAGFAPAYQYRYLRRG